MAELFLLFGHTLWRIASTVVIEGAARQNEHVKAHWRSKTEETCKSVLDNICHAIACVFENTICSLLISLAISGDWVLGGVGEFQIY